MIQPADDWPHWFYLHRAKRTKKSDVAVRLGVDRAYFSRLLDPDRYRPRVHKALARRIAALWGQPIAYVERYYARTERMQ